MYFIVDSVDVLLISGVKFNTFTEFIFKSELWSCDCSSVLFLELTDLFFHISASAAENLTNLFVSINCPFSSEPSGLFVVDSIKTAAA